MFFCCDSEFKLAYACMSISTERRQLDFSFWGEPEPTPKHRARTRARARKNADRQLVLFHPYEQADLPIH